MTNRRKSLCPRESVASRAARASTAGNCLGTVKRRELKCTARDRVQRSVAVIRPRAAKITPGRKRRRSPGSEHPPATLMKKYFLNKMSTGKRLAKRSIVGTRVCAPGTDGIWYSGKIEFVKTAADQKESAGGGSGGSNGASVIPGLTTPARYTVMFDNTTDVAGLGLGREFRETELIGPGFRTIADVKLKPGQKVFLTYNGRENAGEVITHDDLKDEVKVRITVGSSNSGAQEVNTPITENRGFVVIEAVNRNPVKLNYLPFVDGELTRRADLEKYNRKVPMIIGGDDGVNGFHFETALTLVFAWKNRAPAIRATNRQAPKSASSRQPLSIAPSRSSLHHDEGSQRQASGLRRLRTPPPSYDYYYGRPSPAGEGDDNDDAGLRRHLQQCKVPVQPSAGMFRITHPSLERSYSWKNADRFHVFILTHRLVTALITRIKNGFARRCLSGRRT
uniref:DUF4772 domain-containing protein n=1 Tax=Anopheles atroparvus TaxID=41427 RepID=A0A182IK56_ANOAO